MSISEIIRQHGPKPGKRRSTPLWKGPEEDGITFSMMSRFLVCRERFRLLAMEGLRPTDRFNHRIEYGQMWHTCEESLAANPKGGWHQGSPWVDSLTNYAQKLCTKYPLARGDIEHWYRVCRVEFPLYAEWWSKHDDVKNRTPLLQEQVFDVPYKLPSGRTVKLRGKWDSVDLISGEGIFIQENKSKGDIDEPQLRRQLTFDLQTMIYLVAFERFHDINVALFPSHLSKPVFKHPLMGVRYNVIRRPLSGGKGSIVQHKPTKKNPKGESSEAFYMRVGQYIKDEPAYFFMRWKCKVKADDITKFRKECLDPELENLCDDFEWWRDCFINGPGGGYDHWDMGVRLEAFPHHQHRHARRPFGVYNVLDEGGSSDLDEYLASGSEMGLQRVEALFTELT